MKERVLNYIRKHGLMRPGDRVGVAVSGGADSVALLRLLLELRAELGISLSVVHFNHKIRSVEADQDEKFVRGLAQGLDLEFHSGAAETPAYAREHRLSLEAAARELRYRFFWSLVTGGTVHRVAVAHSRDDQAETVLMRFLRGSGTKGLAAVYPELRLEQMYSRQQIERRALPVGESPWIVRPLLQVTRGELRASLQQLGQSWREDASNADVSFTRNRLRNELMPLLTRDYNPALAEVLSDMAEIARGEEEYWEREVRQRLERVAGLGSSEDKSPTVIDVQRLREETLAMQRRLVRATAEQHGLRLEFRHVEEVLAMAGAPASAAEIRVELPHGWEAVRQGGELWFRNRCQAEQTPAYDLALPLDRTVEAAGRKIRAALVPTPQALEMDGRPTRVVLLDARLIERKLRVRNWRPGDRYWPAHTKEPKKVKELLQARHIPRVNKAMWPVVLSGEEIVWVPGFAAPERFRVREGSAEALLLEVV